MPGGSARKTDGHRVSGSRCATCGKLGFPSRRAAQQEARRRAPDGGVRPYRCGDMWHYGHLPRRVQTGDVAASEVTHKIGYRTSGWHCSRCSVKIQGPIFRTDSGAALCRLCYLD